jgi:hypothetical protein
MSNLTGQQIQNTYPGLLNLATATTGITTTPQQIQDGLGNNTGVKIATNFLTAPNVLGVQDFKADYYGLGFTANAGIPVASTQNIIIAQPFYDNGVYDYSAITYNIVTATTSSDVLTCSFYSSQYVDGVGLAPSVLIQSGITLTTNSTGVKVTTLPSTLSFSGYGPGYYWWVYKYSNSGATPTVRPASTSAGAFNTPLVMFAKLGFVTIPAGTQIGGPIKSIAPGTLTIAYSGLTNFQTSYSTTDVKTYSTTVQPSAIGMALNTIK